MGGPGHPPAPTPQASSPVSLQHAGDFICTVYLEEKKAEAEQHIKVGARDLEAKWPKSQAGPDTGSDGCGSRASIPKGALVWDLHLGGAWPVSSLPPHPAHQDDSETPPCIPGLQRTLRGEGWITQQGCGGAGDRLG